MSTDDKLDIIINNQERFKTLLLTVANAIHKVYGPTGRAVDEAVANAAAKPSTPEEGQAAVEKSMDSLITRESELQSTDIRKLRKILTDLGEDAADVKSLTKKEIVQQIIDLEQITGDGADDEEPEEEDEAPVTKAKRATKSTAKDDELDDADEDDEDEGDDEEVEITEAELKKMNLRELKSLAVDNDFAAADLKGLDKEEIIKLLVGADEEDEDEEDEPPAKKGPAKKAAAKKPEPEEDDEDEDDEEEIEIDLEALDEMSLAELKKLATDIGIELERGDKRADIVAAITEVATEEE